MNIKSDYDEINAQMREIFAEEVAEAEAEGYLVLLRGLDFEATRGVWTADIDLVRDRLAHSVQLRKRVR